MNCRVKLFDSENFYSRNSGLAWPAIETTPTNAADFSNLSNLTTLHNNDSNRETDDGIFTFDDFQIDLKGEGGSVVLI